MKHTLGTKYFIAGDTFILTGFVLNNKEYAMLVNVDDGTRWNDAVEVFTFAELSQLEFNKVVGTHKYSVIPAGWEAV